MTDAADAVDLAIAGGGPAGAALALLAARAGRRAVVAEREAGAHDKVCGDFLSGEAVTYLRALGVDPERAGAARIRRLRLATGSRVVETPLPFEAWSLRRLVLDERLLLAAAAAGAAILRGAAVRALRPAPDGGWEMVLAGAAPVRAHHAVLATGKHDLRPWTRGAGRAAGLVGLKWYVRLAEEQRRALGDATELTLFDGGYAGLQPVDDGLANLCVVVPRARLASLGRAPGRLYDALRADADTLLARRLAGAERERAAPVAVAAIPYGFLAGASPTPGLFRVGDQAAVIPSFTGDGIALALHGAFRAASAFGAGGAASGLRAGDAVMPPIVWDTATAQTSLARDARRPVAVASALSRLVLRPAARRPAVAVAALCPPLLPAIARLTRVPRRARFPVR